MLCYLHQLRREMLLNLVLFSSRRMVSVSNSSRDVALAALLYLKVCLLSSKLVCDVVC